MSIAFLIAAFPLLIGGTVIYADLLTRLEAGPALPAAIRDTRSADLAHQG